MGNKTKLICVWLVVLEINVKKCTSWQKMYISIIVLSLLQWHTAVEPADCCKILSSISCKGGCCDVCLSLYFFLACVTGSCDLCANRFTYEVAPVFVLLEYVTLKKMREIIGWQDGRGDGIFSPGKQLSICVTCLNICTMLRHEWNWLKVWSC